MTGPFVRMKLFCRDLGGSGKPPLVILHGLYGSSRNWVSVGKRLAPSYHALALDLRNHGNSAHASTMGYDTLAGDVLETLEDRGLEDVELMGHSLGGKVAMWLACRHPARIRRLFVLDIAPRESDVTPELLDALLSVDLASVTRRSDAKAQLCESIADPWTRRFLLTNLVREDGGGYSWKLDLHALRQNLSQIAASPLAEDDRYDGPTDFIAGGRSGYVREQDEALILRHFPQARITRLAESGHNVHIEGGEAFLEAVLRPPLELS